jgi:hypothetical protein
MKAMGWMPLLVLLVSCSAPAPEPAAEPEIEPVAVTRWTTKTELFAEYPPLIVGQTARFAIHLTRLDSYKALTAGRIEVHLTGGTGPAEVFGVDAPSRRRRDTSARGSQGHGYRPAAAGTRRRAPRRRGDGPS